MAAQKQTKNYSKLKIKRSNRKLKKVEKKCRAENREKKTEQNVEKKTEQRALKKNRTKY